MRYIPMSEAMPGMKLAHSLYDLFGRTLIGNGIELTENYIDRLKTYGFAGIYVEDEISEGIEVDDIISPSLRIECLTCISQCDVDGCYMAAKKIVEEIMEKKVVSLDLAELRSYDNYTYAHSVNVAIFACVIGNGMGMEEQQLIYLVTAAFLHDLGKLSIPYEILNKPGRLTPEEYQVMKSHATRSYMIISERWDISAHIKEAVLHHHENVDGSGYPHGIDGSQQSIYTKILHVADVYDALISRRPYKKPYSPYEAAEYLMGGCGIMFDYKTVETFLRYVPLFLKGTKVRISDGREGLIYENSGIHNLRPIIKMMDGSFIDLLDSINFSLTIISVTQEDIVSPEMSEKEREDMLKPVRRYHIAVVDDMKTNLTMLNAILEDLYDVTLLKSGSQAINYIKKGQYPDLILMDIDMPEMDGIEAAKRINEITDGTVPILFVTALRDKETVMLCRELNAAGYIIRPYKPVYVKSEIKRIITGRGDVE